jgi:hypothetical protein
VPEATVGVPRVGGSPKSCSYSISVRKCDSPVRSSRTCQVSTPRETSDWTRTSSYPLRRAESTISVRIGASCFWRISGSSILEMPRMGSRATGAASPMVAVEERTISSQARAMMAPPE